MKRKLITLFTFLVCVFTCWSCTTTKNLESTPNQELEIFRTDFKLSQEQKLSQIKAEHIKENKGYIDSDEIVILVNLNSESLIETYNSNYSSRIKSVSDYALSDAGVRQAKAIESEQKALIKELQNKNLIIDVVNTYNTITNAIAVKIKYANFAAISQLQSVSSTIISDTYNLPKTVDTDASAIVNDVDVYETGIYKSDCVDYTGKGTAVAVLDSGFDCSHTVFQHDIDVEMITRSDVRNFLPNTNAAKTFYRGVGDLKLSDVYYSAKIPFVYDYADKDYDVFPYDSEHGTHVAGIIGGEDNTITGIAVDTQLVLLKVFPDLDDGGKTEDILAALEDAVLIGVDAINMSLGSSCGFAREEDGSKINEVYDRINESGISLITAASNSYSSAFGGELGNTNKVTNPDSGTVGSPSTYDAAMSVASISGTKSKYLIGNDSQVIFYSESNAINGTPNDFYKELYEALGKNENEDITLEYVTIPGVGKEINFMGVGDLTGKVALVKRGDNTFEEKAKNAKAAGAVACIIYNNIEGEILMSMGKSDHIPTISISRELGTKLAEKDNGTLKLSYKNQAGPFMSDFSSWGPTPSLGIKPEITAHGGNIKSAVPGGGYDELSGTSMACPNLCGIVVLIRQYLKEEYPDATVKELSIMANQLLMSTSNIILNEQGNPYAVRKQGAGLASLYNAVNTKAYLTVDGIDRSKLELKDDPNRTGMYEMEFNLVNLSSETLKYKLSIVGMTETVSTSDENFVAEKSQILTDEFKAEIIQGGTIDNNVVTVNGNGVCKIKVTYTLTDENKKLIEDSFPYGMYVEGFVKLEDLNDSEENTNINLNIPFLAYYGDWSQAPIFDKTYYEVESEAHDGSIDEEDKLKADYYATTPYGSYYYNYIIPLGTYLYDIDLNKYDAIPATRDHIAISNYLGAVDGISSVYAGLLRGCKTMTVTIKDKLTGEIIYEHIDYNAQKSYYNGMAMPYYDFLNIKSAEYNLINNRQYEFTMTGALDYQNDGTLTNARNSFTFDFYADDEAPVIKKVEYTKEYDKAKKKDRYYLTMTVYDNHYTQAITPIIFTSSSSYTILTDNPIPVYGEKGSDTNVKFEITDYLEDIQSDSLIPNALAFSIEDYALNSDIFICQLPGTKGDFKFTKDGTPEGTDLIILSMYEDEAIDLTKYLSTTDTTVDNEKDYLKYLTWISSNEDVATVKDGVVVGEKAGRVTITVREMLNGKQAVLILNVKDKEESSSNKDVVVEDNVDESTIKSLRFDYFDTLFAYSRAAQTSEIGSTGSRIYVSSLSNGISMYPGEQIKLSYDFDPWYALDNYELTYRSKNPSIAEVDENGKVIAKKKGSTIIELKVAGSNLMASIQVTVKSEFVIENRMLIAYKGLGGEVVIPDDEGILYIGAYAFCLYDTDISIEITDEDYDANKIPAMNTSVTSVIVPEGVEEIQKYAFYNCQSLRKVVLPDSIKFVREYAFCNDTDLKDINLEKVQVIGREAFRNCENLELSNDELSKVYAIGVRAFEGCKAIEYVDLSALRNSGREIFKDCTNLETAILNEHTKLSYAMFVNSGLKTIDIYEKIEIPEYCFALCEKLKKVILHNSLIGIKDGAFSECTSLTDFTAMGEIEYFGEQTFYGDTALETFKLPNSNISIGGYCFYQCSNLNKVEFADNTYISEILGSVFEETNVTNFVVAANNNNYSVSDDGALLLSKDQSKVIFAAPSKQYADYVLDEKYTEIAPAAFSGVSIKTLTINNPNTLINKFAFANCDELEKVVLPTTTGVVIKEHAFNYAAKLEVIENLEYVKTVGDYAFANTNVKKATLADEATYGEGAFFKSNIEEVTIGASTKFGLGAFQNCAQLTKVNMPEANVEFGRGCFAYCSNLATIDLSYVEMIPEECFYSCSNLLRVNLDNCKEIGNYAFSDCAKIVSVVMPKIEKIGEGAFSRYSTFGGAPIFTAVVLPDTLTFIGDGAFLGCEKLSEITIPSSVSSLGDYTFAYCLLLETVNLPDTIEKIGLYTFAGCEYLEFINLENIKEVSDYAFTSCVYLENIDLTNVETIGEAAFADTYVSGTLTMNKLKVVKDFAFQGARINSISASNLEEIGYAAFQNNTQLTSFTFSDKLSKIDSLAFNGCEKLSSFYTPEGKTSGEINDYAKLVDGVLYTYLYNGKLELTAVPQNMDVVNLYVVDGTARIDYYAGNANTHIQRIVLPDGLESIGNYAFYGYNNLKIVEFNSYVAPSLECSYIPDAVLEESDPGYDIIHNQYELFGLELYYYTFIDLVGKKEPIEMVLPANNVVEGYDSIVYQVYFGSVEDATRNTTLAKEPNLVTFVTLANEIKEYENIVIAHEDKVNEALTALRAIKQNYTFFGYSEEEWNSLVKVVEDAQAIIKDIKIKNAKKLVRDTNELLKQLPTEFSESMIDQLNEVTSYVSELTIDEKYLLDLKNYNNLVSEYEDYLESKNNTDQTDPVTPSNPISTTELVIIIICCVVGACIAGTITYFVVKKIAKGKGGKTDEENN